MNDPSTILHPVSVRPECLNVERLPALIGRIHQALHLAEMNWVRPFCFHNQLNVLSKVLFENPSLSLHLYYIVVPLSILIAERESGQLVGIIALFTLRLGNDDFLTNVWFPVRERYDTDASRTKNLSEPVGHILREDARVSLERAVSVMA